MHDDLHDAVTHGLHFFGDHGEPRRDWRNLAGGGWVLLCGMGKRLSGKSWGCGSGHI
jgi:hypothetical protein